MIQMKMVRKMTSHKNFQSDNKKHVHDRHDIYNPAFSSPVSPNDNSNIIRKHLPKWTEFCAYIR